MNMKNFHCQVVVVVAHHIISYHVVTLSELVADEVDKIKSAASAG